MEMYCSILDERSFTSALAKRESSSMQIFETELFNQCPKVRDTKVHMCVIGVDLIVSHNGR